MTNTTSLLLDAIEINPDTPPIGTVIWLHGLGADGNDFAPIVSELNISKNLPIRFIFPHAPMQPVTINNGYIMRAWYDIVSLEIDNHADEKGITTSAQHIFSLIEREETRGIPSQNIIIGGFSQGAVIAMTAGLTYPKPLAGILALSGYLPSADRILEERNSFNKDIPIFLAHGTDDRVVPYFLREMTHEALAKHHCNVAWHSYPMGHSVCLEEIKDIQEWITRIITTRKSV